MKLELLKQLTEASDPKKHGLAELIETSGMDLEDLFKEYMVVCAFEEHANNPEDEELTIDELSHRASVLAYDSIKELKSEIGNLHEYSLKPIVAKLYPSLKGTKKSK